MGRRIVIVGGVGAGASAATRARRLDEQAEITIFEKSGYVSFANCGLPYYVGGVIQDRAKLLVQTPERFYDRFRIGVRVRHEVTAIDRAAKCVRGTNLASGEPFEQPYDRLILCPGADPVIPPMTGTNAANVFVLRNMEDTDAIYEYLAKNTIRSAVIVGAGFIGLEVAEALVHRGVHVDVVELLNQVMAPLFGSTVSVCTWAAGWSRWRPWAIGSRPLCSRTGRGSRRTWCCCPSACGRPAAWRSRPDWPLESVAAFG